VPQELAPISRSSVDDALRIHHAKRTQSAFAVSFRPRGAEYLLGRRGMRKASSGFDDPSNAFEGHGRERVAKPPARCFSGWLGEKPSDLFAVLYDVEDGQVTIRAQMCAAP
jgi:hypothetical protein